MPKLTAWLISVASAAPAMPRPNVKMNKGSSPMFRSPPNPSPTIDRTALPSARRMLLSTKDEHISTVPAKMYFA